MGSAPLANTSEIAAEKSTWTPTGTSWQRQLANAIRDPETLLQRLRLSEIPISLTEGADHFPLLVTEDFAQRMQPGNPADPLLRQVLPLADEDQRVAGFSSDPVSDSLAHRAPGLLQKYHGRALLITTGTCAVHCRYCFRREYPYHDEPHTLQDWEAALGQLEADASVTEVILSGGDPLVLSDQRQGKLFARLTAIPHIERIRLHSRLPIVLPDRVTPELVEILTNGRCQTVLVVHANHGHEIAGKCRDVLRQLVRSGVPVLNQAVLLRGVNDNVAALESLCRRLVNIGVMPYYLHQLDRVNGAAHFEVSTSTGVRLVRELAQRLPGYAVPRYVQEIPGEPGKTPVL